MNALIDSIGCYDREHLGRLEKFYEGLLSEPELTEDVRRTADQVLEAIRARRAHPLSAAPTEAIIDPTTGR